MRKGWREVPHSRKTNKIILKIKHQGFFRIKKWTYVRVYVLCLFFLLIGSSRPSGHPDSEIYLRGNIDTSHELPISGPMKMMCYDKKA